MNVFVTQCHYKWPYLSHGDHKPNHKTLETRKGFFIMTERVSLNLLELVTEEMHKVLEFKPSWVAVATISKYGKWIIFYYNHYYSNDGESIWQEWLKNNWVIIPYCRYELGTEVTFCLQPMSSDEAACACRYMFKKPQLNTWLLFSGPSLKSDNDLEQIRLKKHVQLNGPVECQFKLIYMYLQVKKNYHQSPKNLIQWLAL